MRIRSGLYLGRPVPGAEKKLVDGINDELMPAMRRLPGVAGAMVLWPRSSDEGDHGVFCQILLQFNDEADLTKMMESPDRARIREVRDRILPLFEGRISHVDYETN